MISKTQQNSRQEHKQAMTQHSTLVGGSTAGRLIACPGSWSATNALPAAIDAGESEYAAEGSAMHEVMAELMRARREHEAVSMASHTLTALARSWIGRQFYDRALTQEHLDSMILVALDDLAALEAEYGGGFVVADVEAQVRFPGAVPGGFGTCDVLLQSDRQVIILDWKFGAGVPVNVITRGEDGGEYLNAQLAFYACAAVNWRRKLFTGRDIAVAILQPRAVTTLSHTTVTRRELRYFRLDIEEAVIAALAPNPPRQRGEHCRFAPCKLACPLWTGPLLDLSALGAVPTPQQPDDVVAPEVTPYGQYLAAAKVLCDQLAILKTEVDAQLHNFLSAGGLVPGWRLKNKSKRRQWVDPNTVAKELRKLGFKRTKSGNRRRSRPSRPPTPSRGGWARRSPTSCGRRR
jgi:hypothetical protein